MSNFISPDQCRPVFLLDQKLRGG